MNSGKAAVLVALVCIVPFNQRKESMLTEKEPPFLITLETLKTDYDRSTRRLGQIQIGTIKLWTVERPFIPNPDAPDKIGGGIPFLSAVPLGEYELVFMRSPSKGMQWHLLNPDLHVYLTADDREYEWERYATMLHIANLPGQVKGCIGVGAHPFHRPAQGGQGVSSSALGVHQLKEYLRGIDRVRLLII